MKNKTNFLPLLVAALLTFATKEIYDTEKENSIYKIDYYSRAYAKQKGIDYENISLMGKRDFSDSSPQDNALGLAHNLTNPTAQNVSDIQINLQVTKAFLKTL